MRTSATCPTRLDRSVLVPNQIRTVLETYRDTLFTELFPGRTEVPKTLIFAKDDHHAEEIMQIVREVFGKGNDFAKKITYKTDGGDPEALIRAFRNDYNPRIAVTVDMIATGTDMKPMEVLDLHARREVGDLFRADEGPRRAHHPAEKLRGHARCPGQDPLRLDRRRRRDGEPEDRLAALDRDRKTWFDRLVDEIAAGRRDDDAFATLAARLAALDRKIDDKDRAAIAKASGGLDLPGHASRLLDAIDPECWRPRAERYARSGAEEGRETTKEKAATVFDDPDLRRLLKDVNPPPISGSTRSRPIRGVLGLGRRTRPKRSSGSSASWTSVATSSSPSRSSTGCLMRERG